MYGVRQIWAGRRAAPKAGCTQSRAHAHWPTQFWRPALGPEGSEPGGRVGVAPPPPPRATAAGHAFCQKFLGR
jgi:hypothetical protein